MFRKDPNSKSYGELMAGIINSFNGVRLDFVFISESSAPFGIAIHNGVITNVVDTQDPAVYVISQFVRTYADLNSKDQEDLIKMIKASEMIDNPFEEETLSMYREHKVCTPCECGWAILIEEFVSIFGKENFSKKFQETWQSMQQYTLDFGSTKLIIGGRPLTTIDRLLLYLDRTDIANQFMSNGLGQNAKIDISALKQFAGAWSEYDLAVNSLVELSKGCDVNSEAYLFVKDIISRIGIDNLQESTKLAYLEVFEANKH